MSNDPITRRRALKGIGVASGGLLMSTTGGAREKKPRVSKRTAFDIARDVADFLGDVPEHTEWERTGVRGPQLFYAKVRTGHSEVFKPRAWVFPVENGGSDVGYITVSAVQTESPVLSYGNSKPPQHRMGVAKQVAANRNVSPTNRFVYHGGVEFGIETESGGLSTLKGKGLKELPAANSIRDLSPVEGVDRSSKDQEDREDWTGSVEEGISGVPNWTETDDGGANDTEIGTGPDSWDEWDGCTPVAASMVVGYHLDVSTCDAEERESLIDQLHIAMDTSDEGSTYRSDALEGLKEFNTDEKLFAAGQEDADIAGAIESQIDAGDPTILHMTNGPYSDKKSGHSVCVVGWRWKYCSSARPCSRYYKVHNTWGTYGGCDGQGQSPDRVLHGAWDDAAVTTVSAYDNPI